MLGALMVVGSERADAAGPVTTCTLAARPSTAISGQNVSFRFFASNEPTFPGPTGLVSFFADLDPIPFDIVPLIPDSLIKDHSTAYATKSFPTGAHTVRAVLVPTPTSTPCPVVPVAGVKVGYDRVT